MLTREELRNRFAALLQLVGVPIRCYSGRGMMGDQCVAVHLERGKTSTYIGAMLALAIVQHANNTSDDGADLDALLSDIREDIDTLTGILETGTSQDNLGLGTVVYFPRVMWSEQVDLDGEAFTPEEDEEG
jgi:hypothetical protein